MYVVSPWSRGGWVNSQSLTTPGAALPGSALQDQEENISPRRRAVLGDLTSAFNFVTPNNETLPDLKLLTRAGADQLRTDQQALPQVTVPDPSVQAKPQQRTGVLLARLALRAAR